MTRAVLCVAFAASVAAGGCVRAPSYLVSSGATEAEAVRGQVDGRWFLRDVSTSTGRLRAVEVVYCPIVAEGPVVCRSAIVWHVGESKLLEAAKK